MPEWFDVFWDESEGGNVEHIAEHGVTCEEVESVLRDRLDARQRSRTIPDYWVVFGTTPTGRLLLIVFEYHDDLSLVIPVTAYEPTES